MQKIVSLSLLLLRLRCCCSRRCCCACVCVCVCCFCACVVARASSSFNSFRHPPYEMPPERVERPQHRAAAGRRCFARCQAARGRLLLLGPPVPESQLDGNGPQRGAGHEEVAAACLADVFPRQAPLYSASEATTAKAKQFSALLKRLVFSPKFSALLKRLVFSPSFRRRRLAISGWRSFGRPFGNFVFAIVPAAVAQIHARNRIPEGQTVPKTRGGAKIIANAPHLEAFRCRCVFGR